MKHKYFYCKLTDNNGEEYLLVDTKNGIEFKMDTQFEYLLQVYTFIAQYNENKKDYYIKYNDNDNGKNKFLHRLINNCPDNLQVDHINQNTRDNRLSNLRNVTQSINQRNTKINSNNSSGIQGVCFNTKLNRWVARWTDNENKRKTKSFSVDKYGNSYSMALAYTYRKRMESELGYL